MKVFSSLDYYYLFLIFFFKKKDLLEDGAKDSFNQWKKFYLEDSYYGKDDICLLPPPMKDIKIVYGINVKTEVFI